MEIGETLTLRKPGNRKPMGEIRCLATGYEAYTPDGVRIVANRRLRPDAGRFTFDSYHEALNALRYYRA